MVGLPFGHGPVVRPRDVPGYGAAVASGLTPRRPVDPPVLLPGVTAHRALHRCGVALAFAAGLVVCAMVVGPERAPGQASLPGVLLILGATAIGSGVAASRVRRFREVLLAELAAGYVTTTFLQGMFWLRRRSGPHVPQDAAGWCWDGVWVLNRSGRVVSAPQAGVEAPGFYPSPDGSGTLELWTGAQWTGVHRRP